jgi:hypothetical protein
LLNIFQKKDYHYKNNSNNGIVCGSNFDVKISGGTIDVQSLHNQI